MCGGFMSRAIVVVGTGSYVPAKVVTNEEIFSQFESLSFPNGKGGTLSGREMLSGLAKRTGYVNRHKIADSSETVATMGVEAGKKALKDAGLKPEDIDLIVLSTDSPDFISPPTSSRIQFDLGAVNAAFYDVNAACAGYTIALSTAAGQMQIDKSLKNVMVVGGYAMSRYSDPEDPITELMFADGAGVVILQAQENSNYGIKDFSLKGEGKYWDHMGIYAGGTWKGFEKEALDAKLHHVKFLKPFPADVNIQAWPALVEKTLAKSGWTKQELKKLFFTQVNLSVIEKVCEVLGVDISLTHNIMDKYGYTGSACIPMALDDACQKGLLKAGDKIAVCTSGGGAAFAAMTLIWGK